MGWWGCGEIGTPVPRWWECKLSAKSLQSCPTLCDPMDYSTPGSSVHGILQARILEWVAMPSSRGSSPPRHWTRVSYVFCIAGGFFTMSTTWEAQCKVTQPLWTIVLRFKDAVCWTHSFNIFTDIFPYIRKTVCFLRKLKIELSYDPAILLLCMYSKDLESGYQKDACSCVQYSTTRSNQGMETT